VPADRWDHGATGHGGSRPRRVGSSAALNGNGEGDWKLRFIDSGTAGGTLNNWTLTFPANLSFS
jgi:subtilisin-like proprotein convertase family protein